MRETFNEKEPGTMIPPNLDYLAIVVAAAASFIFGSIWYMALAKPWAGAQGKSASDFKPSPGPFLTAIIAQLVMAFILAVIIALIASTGDAIKNGLITAAMLWLGFVVTTMCVNHAFQGCKAALTVIDVGHWLGVMLVQGLVLGLFAG
jgi:hypothetical protein